MTTWSGTGQIVVRHARRAAPCPAHPGPDAARTDPTRSCRPSGRHRATRRSIVPASTVEPRAARASSTIRRRLRKRGAAPRFLGRCRGAAGCRTTLEGPHGRTVEREPSQESALRLQAAACARQATASPRKSPISRIGVQRAAKNPIARHRRRAADSRRKCHGGWITNRCGAASSWCRSSVGGNSPSRRSGRARSTLVRARDCPTSRCEAASRGGSSAWSAPLGMGSGRLSLMLGAWNISPITPGAGYCQT